MDSLRIKLRQAALAAQQGDPFKDYLDDWDIEDMVLILDEMSKHVTVLETLLPQKLTNLLYGSEEE